MCGRCSCGGAVKERRGGVLEYIQAERVSGALGVAWFIGYGFGVASSVAE